ncbi:hypothetical protein ACFSUP_15245, partial [Gracilibacillus thailandensis]|uniref:hypothetical protein n=1 Tax=Gracilibacillus thailandensis TaxID=563735 RepID=UPI00362D7A0C
YTISWGYLKIKVTYIIRGKWAAGVVIVITIYVKIISSCSTSTGGEQIYVQLLRSLCFFDNIFIFIFDVLL